nr:reverse transcriptase domain-containing protein [Tanacetum cinerariifolium]
MRTRSSSSNLVGESSPNPTSSNPKRRNRRCSKQHFILKESPVDTMADQRTMAELLCAPTEGYVEVIVVPPILAEHFELKHSLINMMTSDQFFGLEKDNPHDHIRWFNKINFTIKYRDVPNLAIKLMLFPFSLAGAARRWLERESPRSILTWEDLISKFINEFFTPSRTINLCNEISNFQQRFDESFHEAWDRYKDLLRAFPHHGFAELHQLDTLYNALNPADQDSLNSAAGGNLLERRTQDVLTIIENKSKCLAADGNTFPEFRDNIQGYVSAAAVNYSQANLKDINRGNNFNQDSSYQAPIQQNQVVPLSELEKIKKINKINIKAMQTQINNVKNELRNEMKTSIQASMSNQTNELKNMMASFFQMNTASSLGSKPLLSNTIANPKGELKAITTQSGLVLDGPSVHMPFPFINPEEDERVEETLTDPELGEFTIKVPPPLVQKVKPPSQRNYMKMLKALMSNKEKLLELANTPLNKNYSAVILKKLPKKLRDPGKFLISCGFSKLKCKALSDLESINMINIYDDSCEDYLEDFFATNHQSGNPTFSFHPDLTSPEVKDDIFDLEGDIVLFEKLLNTDSTKDLPLSHNINPLSGSTTSSSPDYLLEEFADELALTPGNDDLLFDIESNLREIEYLLNHDPTKEMDSILEDSVDEGNLANPNLVDTILEMFTDEHTLDYSSPPLYDEYDDDLVELEFDNDDAYDDLFDSKEDKIKESKLLIDELDSSRSSDFLPSPEYDSFLFEDFFEVDALPSTNYEDKVFNLGILIHENLSEVIVQIAPDKNVKKISISHASLILKDFDPPLYELPFYKEVPGFETLLSFSSKNEEKIFKPGILTSKGVHTSLLPELSHQGPKAFKVIKICESPMEIFPCSYG